MVFSEESGVLLVLIETYWNVKEDYVDLYLQGDIVLIETYWNVKSRELRNLEHRPKVLIETYWNVKTINT